MIRRAPLIIAAVSVPLTLLAQSPAPMREEAPPAPRASTSSTASTSSAPAVATLSAPTGYILSPNDQVAVEVFGEEDLRTNGRLNGEGNLSVPLLGSIHLAGMTLSQAASKLTDL